MIETRAIAQPDVETTLDAIERVIRQPDVREIDVAAAYITSGGAHEISRIMNAALGAASAGITKRWITSFDYCRTEPVALRTLMAMPQSTVRVYDADFCLAHKGNPRVPFHPKMFLVRSDASDYALAGSGNVSRSGLTRGIEAGLAIGTGRTPQTVEPATQVAVTNLRDWFSNLWNLAPALNGARLAAYENLYDTVDNRKSPTPTEDDLAAPDDTRGSLSSSDLVKLRVCQHLWIDAGKITKNRGPNLPGNQLMTKRMTRVFFGFKAESLPKNTVLGQVQIRFGQHVDSYTLSFSDNGMDKLNLPVPEGAGPASYENAHLMFKRTGPRSFELTTGTAADRARWARQSKAVVGEYKMSSGREWGVF